MSSPDDVRAYLDSFINYETGVQELNHNIFKLDRVKFLAEALGSPHHKLKIIHVAGTKGKGSTCALTTYMLRKAGYKVGLYTSPHLIDYAERIRILSPGDDFPIKNDFAGKITPSEFRELIAETKPVIEKIQTREDLGRLSFFEVITALAFFYFHKEKVDWAVIETGLGGRLDATNISASKISALTPISLEHTKQLGSTIKEIAGEKAAIIKPETVVVVAEQHPEALTVIEDKCRKVKAQMILVGKDLIYKSTGGDLNAETFDLQTPNGCYSDLKVPFLGKHQLINAATAVGLVEQALKDLNNFEPAIRGGMMEARWPGRLEILSRKPLILADGAHTPSAARTISSTVQAIAAGKKVTLILGVSNDKDIKGIMAGFESLSQEIIFTKADHPRAMDLSEGELKIFFPGKKIAKTKTIREALEKAAALSGKDDVILITGSLFVVGEAKKYVSNKS